MKCATCGHDSNPSARFCPLCGTELARTCLSCGHANNPLARFCEQCGAQFGTPSTSGRSDVIDAASRLVGDGERKLVTILFADIVDSTDYIAHRDTEDAADSLDALILAMRDSISRFGGTVNKLQGDGFMAIFGAPRPQEDHAVRACCAAMAMAQRMALQGPERPAVRIGVHSGEAILRSVSTDVGRQYDASGIAVHIAARAEQVADRDSIVVTEATAKAAGDQIAFEALGSHALKGVPDPIFLFRPLHVRSQVASDQFRGGQRLAPFQGRQSELAVLRDALSGAHAGRAGVVAIQGEPGLGKSRLLFEFTEQCREAGIAVVEARATAQGLMAPHHTALSLLRAMLQIEAGASPSDVTSRMRDRLSDLGGIEDSELDLALDFFGLAPASTGKPPVDPSIRRARLVALAGRLARAAGKSGAIIVVEDLHWLDPSSVPFLEAIVDAIAETRALLLVSFRPGFAAAWLDGPLCTRLELRPLATHEIYRAVAQQVAGSPQLTSRLGEIAARAAGNPFFAEELVRILSESSDQDRSWSTLPEFGAQRGGGTARPAVRDRSAGGSGSRDSRPGLRERRGVRYAGPDACGCQRRPPEAGTGRSVLRAGLAEGRALLQASAGPGSRLYDPAAQTADRTASALRRDSSANRRTMRWRQPSPTIGNRPAIPPRLRRPMPAPPSGRRRGRRLMPWPAGAPFAGSSTTGGSRLKATICA